MLTISEELFLQHCYIDTSLYLQTAVTVHDSESFTMKNRMELPRLVVLCLI